MSSYAHIKATVPCPACGDVFSGPQGYLGFQWGYCPARSVEPAQAYSIGDTLRWREDRSGAIRGWVYFEGVQQAGNLGDPDVASVVVRESELARTECPRCKHRFAFVGIVIEDSVITEVRIFESDSREAADIYEIRGGRLIPRPEWDDHPMPDIIEGGAIVSAP